MFSGFRRGFPKELELIIMRGLDADPDKRQQSADKLKEDLVAYLNDKPVPSHTYSKKERLVQFANKHVKKIVAGVGATVAGLGLVAVLGYMSASRSDALAKQRQTELRAAVSEQDALESRVEAQNARLEAQSARMLERQQLLNTAIENQDWQTAREHLGAVSAYADPSNEDLRVRLASIERKIDGYSAVNVSAPNNFAYDIDPINAADNPDPATGSATFDVRAGTYRLAGSNGYRDILVVPHGGTLNITVDNRDQIDGMRLIPANAGTIGRLENERPINMPAFYISENPVTFREYFEFLQSNEMQTGRLNGSIQRAIGTTDRREIQRELIPHIRDDRRGYVYINSEEVLQANGMNLDSPVVGIAPRAAGIFAEWKTMSLGREYQLPQEEHMRQAWGERSGRRYPWGDRMNATLLPPLEERVGRSLGTLIVNADASPTSDYGVHVPNVQSIITDGTNFYAFGGRYKDISSEGFSAPFGTRYMSDQLTGSDVGFSLIHVPQR